MIATAIAFISLLLAALTAGAMFGVWLGMNPHGLAPAVYVAQQQQLIRAMNGVMPLLGVATTLGILACAAVQRGERTRLILLLTASTCFVVAGLITRLLNQPINAVVMTWPVQAPPAGWEQLRDLWWRWHALRTLAGIAGLCLLIAASLGPGKGP